MAESDCCPGCKQLSDDLDMDGPVITLNKKLEDFGKNIETFKEAMTAVMNSKGGYVLIHASNPRCLEGFDHKADSFLKKIIPEGSFYHDHFRRYITEDGDHVVFNIRPQPANRPLICVNGNSKVSLNMGVEDITHTQLHSIFQRILEMPNEERIDRNVIPDRRDQFMSELKEDTEITCGNGKFPFQENIFIQAKCPHEENKKENKKEHKENTGAIYVNGAKCLVNDYLFKFKLQHYISAFSKLDGGGSYYFGVDEHKEKKKFRCTGFLFPENQENEIESTLLKKMKEEMLCVGTYPHKNPVTVKLHPVEPKTNDAQQEQQHPKQPEEQEPVDTGATVASGCTEKTPPHPVKPKTNDVHQKQQDPPKQPQEQEPMAQGATVASGCTGTTPAHGNVQPKLYILEVKVNHYQHGAVFHTKDGPDIFRYDENEKVARKQKPENWLVRFNETGQNFCRQVFQ